MSDVSVMLFAGVVCVIGSMIAYKILIVIVSGIAKAIKDA